MLICMSKMAGCYQDMKRHLPEQTDSKLNLSWGQFLWITDQSQLLFTVILILWMAKWGFPVIETGSSFAVNLLHLWLRVLDFGSENSKFGQVAFISLKFPSRRAGLATLHVLLALDSPNIRESQGTSQVDLCNFRHCSDDLSPAWLPWARRSSREARSQFSKPPKQVSFDLGLARPVSSCSLSSLFFNSPVLASHTFLSWCLFCLLIHPITLLSEHLS